MLMLYNDAHDVYLGLVVQSRSHGQRSQRRQPLSRDRPRRTKGGASSDGHESQRADHRQPPGEYP